MAAKASHKKKKKERRTKIAVLPLASSHEVIHPYTPIEKIVSCLLPNVQFVMFFGRGWRQAASCPRVAAHFL
jgi:hypothetical protein